ncbi:hypothetical protein [Streptomyces sp. NPDC091027]|uniref:hypothetical protein n=1 Tax=Streptomyces sp. NPDC091027 TaxID=3365971 RepID=UPI0038302B88
MLATLERVDVAYVLASDITAQRVLLVRDLGTVQAFRSVDSSRPHELVEVCFNQWTA